MSTEIKLTIKQTNGAKAIKDITILSDNSVQDLKLSIESQFNIPPGKQNLIFKGRVLFNERKLDDCGLKDNDVVLLVEKLNDTNKEEQKPLHMPLQSGVGTPGVVNLDLLKQPMSGNVNLEQMEEILKRPEIAGQLDDMLNDPQVLNAMMENPAIKPMLDANPMMRSIMSNPQFMKNLLSPESIEMMKNMQGLGMGMGMNNQQSQSSQQQQPQSQSQQPMPQMNPFAMFNPYMMGMGVPPNQQGQTQTTTTTQAQTQNSQQETQTQPQAQPSTQQPQMNPMMMNPFAMFNPYMMGMGQQGQPGQQGQSQSQPGMTNPMMMNPFAMYNPYFMGMNPNSMQGTQQQQQPNLNTLSKEALKKKFKTQIEQLNEMGFTNEEDNINALIKTEGNIEAAVERLFDNQNKNK